MIDRQAHAIPPEVRGIAGLSLEKRHEVVRLRELLPDLREKRGPPRAVLKNDPVDAGTEATQGIGFAAECEWLWHGQHGNLDAYGGQFVGFEGWKARVVKSGGAGVVRHVVVKRAMRFERADAAAQLPVKRECDERGRRFIEPDRTLQGGPWLAEFGRNGPARQSDEEPPSVLMFRGQDDFFRKGHRRVSGGAALDAGRAAGSRPVYQAPPPAPSLGLRQQLEFVSP